MHKPVVLSTCKRLFEYFTWSSTQVCVKWSKFIALIVVRSCRVTGSPDRVRTLALLLFDYWSYYWACYKGMERRPRFCSEISCSVFCCSVALLFLVWYTYMVCWYASPLGLSIFQPTGVFFFFLLSYLYYSSFSELFCRKVCFLEAYTLNRVAWYVQGLNLGCWLGPIASSVSKMACCGRYVAFHCIRAFCSWLLLF